MVEGIKLARIKYNEKMFDIFVDEKHEKHFLEVRIKDGKELFYHPVLDDLVKLNLIYNTEKEEKYNKKYKFKKGKIRNLRIRYQNIKKINNFLTFVSRTLICLCIGTIVGKTFSESDTGNQIISSVIEGSYINPDKTSELSNFGIDNVTFDELRVSLDDNPNIDSTYKEYISEYINLLERKLPNIDIRMLNVNLKTLKIVLYDGEYLPQSAAAGNNNSNKNEIKVCIDYPEDSCKHIFFHELTHSLSNCYYRWYDSTGLVAYTVFKHYEGANDYGVSLDEGFTEIISDFLLSDDNTLDEYLKEKDRDFFGYNAYIAPITYHLLQLTSDEYNLYDYIDGKVYDYVEILSKYDLVDLVDYMDIIQQSNSNSAEVKLSNEFNEQLDKLNKLLDNKDNFRSENPKSYIINYN